MTEDTIAPQATAEFSPLALTPSRLGGQVILLATDHSAGASAATRVADRLATRLGARPHAVRAFDLSTIALPGPLTAMIAAADELLGSDAHHAEVTAIEGELSSLLGHRVHWPIHIRAGTPAGVIVRDAAEVHAALIVMGIRRHGMLDRVTRDETTLNVMRAAPVPVLGVTPSRAELPASVVVGVDFSATSLEAARWALDLVGPRGTLVLAHVHAGLDVPDAVEPAGAVEPVNVDAAFDQLVAALAPPAAATLTRVQLGEGEAKSIGEGLLAIASEHQADLIAVGTRRHGWVDRAMMGSVSTELARDGRHSLLVVPPAATPPPAHLQA